MKAFLCLGKFGDVLSALPIAQHYHATTGETPSFVVAKQYASVVRAALNVTPVIWPNHWTDLKPALLDAKKQFNDVTCLQLYGQEYFAEQKRSSFQLDQYERAGVLEMWDKLPLNLNISLPRTPHPILEAAKKSNYILYCDRSQSSPFQDRNELEDDLTHFGAMQFPPLQVVRASQIILDDIVDFVPIMDCAKAVVCVESAFLHLSRASVAPVIALATDKPTKWHGSAWSERFAFYCRYGEYPERKQELLEVLDGVVNSKEKVEVVRL